jgi:hypothetical protein
MRASAPEGSLALQRVSPSMLLSAFPQIRFHRRSNQDPAPNIPCNDFPPFRTIPVSGRHRTVGGEPQFRIPARKLLTGSSKVPEPTGKRLRRFVCQSSPMGAAGNTQSACPSDWSSYLPSASRPLHFANWTPLQRPNGHQAPVLWVAHPGSRKQPQFSAASATLSATSGFPGYALAIPLL